MGKPKQLLKVGEKPMVRHVANAVCASGVDQVIVVVGAHGESVERALLGLPVKIVSNPNWKDGLSTSVRAGINALASGTEANNSRIGPNVPVYVAGLLRGVRPIGV